MASITRRLVKTNNPEKLHLKFLVKEGRQHVCEVVTWIILRVEFSFLAAYLFSEALQKIDAEQEDTILFST